MSHSYSSILIHCVFSVKERAPLLAPELRSRLFPYMGGIAREYGSKLLGVGGIENHVHLLLSLPSTQSTAQTIQLIKGGSSHWIHETFPDQNRFAWQEGYGAFSIGISHQEKTLRYIQNQETHHRKVTFEEKYRAILQRHGIDFDEKYVLG